MDWIYLTQDRGIWRALVNTAMNLQVPWNVGNILSSLGRVTSQEVLLHVVI
jgi:hypothetical protein